MNRGQLLIVSLLVSSSTLLASTDVLQVAGIVCYGEGNVVDSRRSAFEKQSACNHPVPRVKVSVFGLNGQEYAAKTGDDGRFRIEGVQLAGGKDDRIRFLPPAGSGLSVPFEPSYVRDNRTYVHVEVPKSFCKLKDKNETSAP